MGEKVIISLFPESSRSNEERRKRCQDDSILKHQSSNYQNFGYDYFDNEDYKLGYGGYNYDGRYIESVRKICKHYNLIKGDSVLEIGCAKGFILVEFHKLGLNVSGVDVSSYAVQHAHSDIRKFIEVGDASKLPYDNDTFDFVLGKEVLPHIPEDKLNLAIKECIRVSKGPIFFEIQCGSTQLELEYLKRWDGTHKVFRTPSMWDNLFKELAYKGDVHYKILIPEK